MQIFYVCNDISEPLSFCNNVHTETVTFSRARKRSGSSLVVLESELQEPVKKPPDDLDDSLDMVMVVSHGADDGQPHREMAVDVPDSFVARNKTPPRYPPPKPTLTVSILVQFNYLIIFLGNVINQF